MIGINTHVQRIVLFLRRTKAIVVTICFLSLLLILITCTRQQEQPRIPDKTVVSTAPVLERDITLPIYASGRLASKAEMKLSFKIGGIVQRIFVEEGNLVTRGKSLAQLDLSEIQAHVQQARSVHAKAERDLERVQNLYQEKAVTIENFQDARTALEVAASRLKVAEFNLQHATIKAPTKGKIMKRFVETNELVAPGTPIFYFGSSEKDWVVRIGLADRDIIHLNLNDQAKITFDAYPKRFFPATVSEMGEAADPRSGLFEVELRLGHSDYKFISGFIAKVELFPSLEQRFQLIPFEALVEGEADSGFVYVPDESRTEARKMTVQIAHLFNREIAVRTGLENVSEVITSGSQYLTDGSLIKIINPSPASAESGAPKTLGKEKVQAVSETSTTSEKSP